MALAMAWRCYQHMAEQPVWQGMKPPEPSPDIDPRLTSLAPDEEEDDVFAYLGSGW